MDEVGTVYVICDQGARHLIKCADPRIRISPSHFVDQWVGDHTHRDRDIFVIDGDVLTIRDDYGQRFIYRIHWDDYRDGGYLAEWPD